MRVLEIKDVLRKEVPIYYRRDFTGTAVLEIPQKTIESPIEFTIETGPTGQQDIDITLNGSIDYPVIPVIKNIME